MADGPTTTAYSGTARAFHWLTAIAVLIMFVTGTLMTWRSEAGVWDATTNALYSGHKLLGFLLIWVIGLRVAYRMYNGTPAHPPTMNPLLARVAEATHAVIYVLLVQVALLGWLGISLFPALNIFGLFDLPAIAAPDQAQAKVVFGFHEVLGIALFALISVHIAGALAHAIVFKDGVFQRMLPPRQK